ncbi:MAG: TolC family protein [Planctomycetota bacterium]
MRTAAVLLLALGGFARAMPEDDAVVKEITFQDAVDLGLSHNLGLKSARLDALIQRMLVAVEDAAWDTGFSTEVGGGESLTPSRSQLAGAEVLDTDTGFWTMSFTKPTRLGPTLGVNWRTDRTFNNSQFTTINPAFDTALDLTLTVPLLRGFGRGVQEADLRASRASADAARFDLLSEAARVVQDVAIAYWTLVYQQRRVKVLERSLKIAEDIEATERRKARPEIGRSTILDVTTAAAETKRRVAALIAGRNDAADQADELRRLILPFTGGREDRILFRAVGIPANKVKLPSLSATVSDALARRPDLRRWDAELRRLQEGVVRAKDQLNFQLDFRASVGWKGIDTEFADSISNTFSGDFPTAEAAILFAFPFGRRAAKAELRRSKLDVERARVQRDTMVNGVIIEVRTAYRALRTAILEIEATDEERKAAEASLEGERKRLARGTSTVIDVARLEENFTDAQLRLLESQTTLEQARVALLYTSGRLIEAFGIELGPELEPRR